MARADSGLPDALDRRHLLYGTHKREPNFADLGERYEKAGRRNDALECYEKVPDEQARRALIKGLRDFALEEGIHFLLNRIHLAIPLDAKDWLAAALKAKDKGKFHYALASAERAEDAALVTELKEILGIPEDMVIDELAEIEAAEANAVDKNS
jgi:bacterioferritin (cytochrome b1)